MKHDNRLSEQQLDALLERGRIIRRVPDVARARALARARAILRRAPQPRPSPRLRRRVVAGACASRWPRRLLCSWARPVRPQRSACGHQAEPSRPPYLGRHPGRASRRGKLPDGPCPSCRRRHRSQELIVSRGRSRRKVLPGGARSPAACPGRVRSARFLRRARARRRARSTIPERAPRGRARSAARPIARRLGPARRGAPRRWGLREPIPTQRPPPATAKSGGTGRVTNARRALPEGVLAIPVGMGGTTDEYRDGE